MPSIAARDAGRVAGRDGVEAAMEHPDIAVARDAHPDDLAPLAAIHALGKRRPLLREAIRIGKLGRLGILGLLGVCRHAEAGDDDGTG
jgi:hypothetical protein